MDRQQFLNFKWKKYPVLQKRSSFFGRVHEFYKHTAWDVVLVREGQNELRRFENLYMWEHPEADISKILSVGDLISVASDGSVTLLAPQLSKLPLKKMRFEYLRLWPEFLFYVREFFRERDFLEITTPNLVGCPGTEPSLDYFHTHLIRGSKNEKLFLPTSPELHLKKALAFGGERIFEIKTCFRNGEVSENHQPEFTMIEWYRAYESLPSIKRDVADLVHYLVSKMPTLRSPLAYDTFSMQQLFQLHCGFDLKPGTGLEELKDLAQKLKIDVKSATQIDDYFFLIFLSQIESSLIAENLVFIEMYPPYQAALARLTDHGWGDRLEVYWQGLEIANAFHELNDPEVQRERFAADLAKKHQLKKELVPLDQEFLQCLEAGMPPSSGIAMGLERLFMALTGIKDIADTRLFPIK